jgi:hypothetical protein
MAPCGLQLDAMKSVGMTNAEVQHVCTVAFDALNRKPDQIAAVAKYIESRGVKNPAAVMFSNPKLLEYEVDGDELKNGRRARAKVAVTKENGQEKLLVSFFAANASFDAAPIAPWSP